MADIWKAVSHSEGSAESLLIRRWGMGGISIFSQKEKSQTSGSRHFNCEMASFCKTVSSSLLGLCRKIDEREGGRLGSWEEIREGELEEREGMDGWGWGRNSSGCLHTAQKASSGPHTQKLRLSINMWRRTVSRSLITWSLDPVLTLLKCFSFIVCVLSCCLKKCTWVIWFRHIFWGATLHELRSSGWW